MMGEWLFEKLEGPGRDPLEASASDGSSSVVVLREQLRGSLEAEVRSWPFKGPRAVVEFMRGAVAGDQGQNMRLMKEEVAPSSKKAKKDAEDAPKKEE